jgi:hypothetical protein
MDVAFKAGFHQSPVFAKVCEVFPDTSAQKTEAELSWDISGIRIKTRGTFE